jgi:hypothetical protein
MGSAISPQQRPKEDGQVDSGRHQRPVAAFEELLAAFAPSRRGLLVSAM